MLENKLSVFNLYKGVDKEIRIFLDLIQSDSFVSRSGRVIFCDLKRPISPMADTFILFSLIFYIFKHNICISSYKCVYVKNQQSYISFPFIFRVFLIHLYDITIWC